MPQENTKPVESRERRDERLNREQDQETSRVKFNNFIQHINDASVGYVFSKQRREETRKKRQDLRNENPDEAKAGIHKKVGFIIVLLALVAVGVVDYLIIGGTVDYLLGMHRELQEYEYLVHLKILAIIVLIVIEIAIAVGVAQLRRKYKSKSYTVLHWFIGIGLALALTFFAGALMYTKIANEAEQSVMSVVESATDISSAQDEEEEKIIPKIPTQKWMLDEQITGKLND
jgi:cytochrome b561